MDGKVTISTALDNSGFKSGVQNIAGSLGGLKGVLTKIGALVTTAFAVKKLVQFGAACVTLGSDVAEVQNVVDTAFGSMAYKMEAFAGTAITNFGMSALAAKKTGSTYMAMAKGIGLADGAASDMAIALTGLTGDVASFYNISQEEADTKLKSVFTGETETLKSLGVVMTQTNLDAYALANGFGKTTSAMNQAELVQLRYAYVTNALSLASGDFLKTQDSWANQTRILSMQWQQFMSVIGQALTTVLLPAVKILNTIVAALIKMANSFNATITAIFGGANKQIQSTADTAAGVAGAISDSVDQQNALTDATKKTAKAQNSLGIDELNVVSQDSGSAASTAGTAAAGTGGLSETVTQEQDGVTEQMQQFVDKITAMLAPLKTIDFTPLQKSFQGLKDAIAPLTQNLFAGLNWAYYNIFVPLAQWTIQDFLPAFLDVLAGTIEVLNTALETFKPLNLWLWQNFLQPIAEWTGGVVVTVMKDLAGALKKISDWISQNQGLVQGMSVTAAVFCGAWVLADGATWLINGGMTRALLKVKDAIDAGLISKLASKAEDIQLIALYAKDYVVAFAKNVAAIASATAAWIASTAAKVADTVAQWALNAATTAWSAICAIAKAATTAFGAAVAFLMSPIGLVILAIGALIAIVVLLVKNWDTVKATAAAVWTAIKGVWAAAGQWFNTNVVQPIASFFGGLWEGIKSGASVLADFMRVNVIDPIVSLFRGLYNSVVGIMEGIVNGFVGIINSFISGINGVIGVINKIPGVSLPALSTLGSVAIPRLAQGAVIPANREFLAVLGDQRSGTNIEAPLDTIKQALAEVMAQVGNNQNITLNITTTLDGEVVYRNQQKIKAGKGYPVGMNPAFV